MTTERLRLFCDAGQPCRSMTDVNPIRTLLTALLLLCPVASPAFAQQEILRDPEVYEKEFFQKRCGITQFEPGFIIRQDINNDGLTDMVANQVPSTVMASADRTATRTAAPITSTFR